MNAPPNIIINLVEALYFLFSQKCPPQKPTLFPFGITFLALIFRVQHSRSA